MFNLSNSSSKRSDFWEQHQQQNTKRKNHNTLGKKTFHIMCLSICPQSSSNSISITKVEKKFKTEYVTIVEY